MDHFHACSIYPIFSPRRSKEVKELWNSKNVRLLRGRRLELEGL